MNLLKSASRTLAGALAATLLIALPALAQETPVKFQLDWRFEGPAAMFLVPVAKGYFKAEKLNVSVDAGNGSGGAVTRVATGAYDMGFADLAALIEFHANNSEAKNKPVAVMMVYNNTPAARRGRSSRKRTASPTHRLLVHLAAQHRSARREG